MTTEAHPTAPPRPARLAVFLLVLPLGWLALLAGVMATTDRAPAALVLFPDTAFLAALPPDSAIIAQSALSVTLAGTEPDLTARLYAAGARLVLPAGLQGCAPLS